MHRLSMCFDASPFTFLVVFCIVLPTIFSALCFLSMGAVTFISIIRFTTFFCCLQVPEPKKRKPSVPQEQPQADEEADEEDEEDEEEEDEDEEEEQKSAREKAKVYI